MDKERNDTVDEINNTTAMVIEIIDQWQPDVVIVTDDHAVSNLLIPYYRNANTAFVFCGVNWSIRQQGFPYTNTTGMVEVAPIEAVLEIAQEYVPSVAKVFYLGADTRSESNNVEILKEFADKRGFEVNFELTGDYSRWIEAYEKAQSHDVVIVGNNIGVKPWYKNRAAEQMRSRTRRMTITMYEWMMPYSSFGTTTVLREQGDWAGQVVLEILNGVSPQDIPVVANRRWEYWVNQQFLHHTGLSIPNHVRNRVKEYVASD